MKCKRQVNGYICHLTATYFAECHGEFIVMLAIKLFMRIPIGFHVKRKFLLPLLLQHRNAHS